AEHCKSRPQKFARGLCRLSRRLSNNRSSLFPGQNDTEQIHRDGNVLQLCRRQFFEARFKGAADLAFHIRRNTYASWTSQRLDARSDVYSVAINVMVAMNNITDVNADL